MATRDGGSIPGLVSVPDGATTSSIFHGGVSVPASIAAVLYGGVGQKGLHHASYNATMGVQGGVRYYKKQARDSGAPTPTYVTWETTDPYSSFPGTAPFGGPLVEETIMAEWSV